MEFTVKRTGAKETATSFGPGRLGLRGYDALSIFSFVFEVPQTRMIAPDLQDGQTYDLSVSLPGAKPEVFNHVARPLLCAAFKVKAERKTRQAGVVVLTAPQGKPEALQESDGYSSGYTAGRNRIQMRNSDMEALSSVLENVVGKPVIDETKLDFHFDLTLNFQNPDSLFDELRKLGLQVELARRPIEFLVITPAR